MSDTGSSATPVASGDATKRPIPASPLWRAWTSDNTYAALLALLAFIAYLRTLAPTVMWYDRGEFAVGSYVLGIAHNTGYPLYMLLGKLFTLLPVGDVAYRVNLMSAVFAALAVAVAFLIVRLLTRKVAPALAAGATLAFISTFWSNAIWAEPHSLNVFLTGVIVYLLLLWRRRENSRYLYIASLVFGLSLGNHRLILFMLPAMALFVLFEKKTTLGSLVRKPLVYMAALMLLGFSVNLYLPLRANYDPLGDAGYAATLGGFFDTVFKGQSETQNYDFSPAGVVSRLPMLWDFPRYEFSLPGVLLALSGLFWLARGDRTLLTLTLLPAALTALVVVTFMVHDIYDYFLPIYFMASIWIGVGAHRTVEWATSVTGKRTSAGGLALSSKTKSALLYVAVLTVPLGLLLSNFQLLDRSKDYEAYDFALNTMSVAPRDSVVVSDWWAYFPLLYLQEVEGLRRDMLLLYGLSEPDWDPIPFIESQLSEGKNVYFAEGLSTEMRAVSERFALVPITLQAITTPVVKRVPRPQYKDLLVVKRDLFQVVRDKPPLRETKVPLGARGEITFGGELTLVAAEVGASTVARGESLPIDYHWRLERSVDDDLFFKVVFVDALGRVPTKQGYQLWFQGNEVGGVRPTSGWEPGQSASETYHTLVPRQLSPGTYELQLRVFNRRTQDRELPPSSAAKALGVTVGHVDVE